MCFYGIICFISQCIYLPRSLNSYYDLNIEESKPMDVLDKTLPSRNLGTNPKELHTPKSTPKKTKRDGGDMVFYKNEA